MFESLKKNKTLRSLLAASALFGAGALGAKAAEPAAPSAKEAVQTKVDDPLGARLNLMKAYQVLTEVLEDNLCYCYSDKGVPTCGSGVHFRDFYDLKDVIENALIDRMVVIGRYKRSFLNGEKFSLKGTKVPMDCLEIQHLKSWPEEAINAAAFVNGQTIMGIRAYIKEKL